LWQEQAGEHPFSEGIVAVPSPHDHFELGVNIIPASNAYDLVLLSEFMSPEELVSYQKHPEHVRVAEVAGQVCESRIVVDYTC